MSYKTEFPDFALDVEIPEGFADQSWHNDVCPRFDKQLPDETSLVIWIDYLNPTDRECPNEKRFAVALYDDECTHIETLIESDSWQEIIDFIKGDCHERN